VKAYQDSWDEWRINLRSQEPSAYLPRQFLGLGRSSGFWAEILLLLSTSLAFPEWKLFTPQLQWPEALLQRLQSKNGFYTQLRLREQLRIFTWFP